MKTFDERLTEKPTSQYVAKITVDTDILSLRFHDNTSQNHKNLKGIFSTYKCINNDGQEPINYELVERQPENEIVLTGDLRELVGLIRNMRLISEETKQSMSEFLDETLGSSKSFCNLG